MVGTLGKGSRLERTGNAALHVLGSTAAAAAVGFTLAAIGGLIPMRLGVGLGAAVCFAYGMMELGWIKLPLPETGRQVPATWRYRLPPAVTATLYGALLGPGFGTRVVAASYVALLAVTPFVAYPVVGALLLGIFGLTRATAAAVAAQYARGDVREALSWGYRTGDLWRLAGIVLTFLIAGALAAEAVVRHIGT